MKKTCSYCGRRYHLDHVKRCRKFKEHCRSFFSYIMNVCTLYGIPFHLVECGDDVQWNGRSMPIVDNPYYMDMIITPHEIAHWIYAEPVERLSPNFLMTTGQDDHKEVHVRFIESLLIIQSDVSIINSFIQSIKELNVQLAV